MFYSKSTGGFYDTDIHGDNIPSDAVEITSEEHAALLAGQSAGKIITADADGRPVLTDPPPTPFSDIKATVLAQVRAAREVVLNRLAGIGFAAQADGDSVTVSKVLSARTALLNITTAPEVVAATDEAGLKAALVTEYAGIVVAAGLGLVGAFAEFSL